MDIAVLGSGSWGTALGAVLAEKGYGVRMWDVDPGVLEEINAGENHRYLPGISLPATVAGEPSLQAAVADTQVVVFAVPSHAMRSVAEAVRELLPPQVLICSVTKGIEVDTLMTMSEVLEDVLPPERHQALGFLSGPSFAVEVARHHPTAVTVASHHEPTARAIQEIFHTSSLRPYTSTDVVGVEIGGCVKNVIAIATGMSDGLGYDMNPRAALITRGLAEITRLAVARGADPHTLSGLSGVGDLVLTASSNKSRNYRVGYALGQGRTVADIQAELGQVAEGVLNAKSVHALAQRTGVEMPICDMIYRLLYEQDITLDDVVHAYGDRPLRSEKEDHHR